MLKKIKAAKAIHPELYSYKVFSPSGEFYETVTTKINQKGKENLFRLEMMQKDHPAWTGNIFGRTVSSKNTSRTKNTNIDIFSAR
jgi:ribosomal protein L31